jgi:hypothetical protein
MTELIDLYFMKHLELSREDAFKLHQEYYKNYGLAIEGIVRHHRIDPLEYNRQVDDALPLESIQICGNCLKTSIRARSSFGSLPTLILPMDSG